MYVDQTGANLLAIVRTPSGHERAERADVATHFGRSKGGYILAAQ